MFVQYTYVQVSFCVTYDWLFQVRYCHPPVSQHTASLGETRITIALLRLLLLVQQNPGRTRGIARRRRECLMWRMSQYQSPHPCLWMPPPPVTTWQGRMTMWAAGRREITRHPRHLDQVSWNISSIYQWVGDNLMSDYEIRFCFMLQV